MTRVTFGDVCGSPETPPERALSVAASCSLRELPRLRSRTSRIADPLARARSAALSCLSGPAMGDCALRAPAGLWVGGWWEAPSLPGGCDAGLTSWHDVGPGVIVRPGGKA